MSVLSVDDDLWCRRYHPSPTATTRLVCFPHAGGSAPFYLPVATALSPDVDVIAIQYPGRQERRAEQPLTDVDAFAERIHDLLLRQPPLPVTFFGHSLGATIAFETVRRLEASGSEVAHLFASGRRAPSAHREAGGVHLRDDDGILAEVRRLNGTAASVLGDQELMRAALPSLRADYQAAETYRCAPEATIDCPVTVLTGDTDPETTLPEAHAWERHTTSTCTVRTFPGGHFFITAHVSAITALLKGHFARTAGSDRGTAVRP
ncbi:thioesterase II family protein [Streptomyces sp. NPDC048434]|uniref:thioesterase II family protein n=1 Tax=Streptomyces sp. NPDC048434 TaxID=3365549 RepID=UPI0037215F3E